jgi:hypothetical protein
MTLASPASEAQEKSGSIPESADANSHAVHFQETEPENNYKVAG